MGAGTPVSPGKPTPAFGHPSQEGMGRPPALASVKLSCREGLRRGWYQKEPYAGMDICLLPELLY